VTRLSRKFRFPAKSSYLAKRQLLEAAGWRCHPDMPPNHHYAAAMALKGLCEASGLPFTSYRLSRVLRINEDTAMELMARHTAFRAAYGELAASRWGLLRAEKEITSFAEQIAPLRIPTPKQLWLLYGVIQHRCLWSAAEAADLMANYIQRALLAQRERLASTWWTKHDTIEDDYLTIAALILREGAAREHYELPMPCEPAQCFNGVGFFIDERPFPALKDHLVALGRNLGAGVKLTLQPDVLEIVSTRV